MNFVLNLDAETCLKLINKAAEKTIDDKLYNRWIFENPNLEKPLSFQDYKKSLGFDGGTPNPPKIEAKADVEDLRDKVVQMRRRKVVQRLKGEVMV